jgi:phosphotransacetylase
MRITCFRDLAVEAARMEKKTVIAVVEAQDEHTLESVIHAASDQIMRPLLIGNVDKISELLIKYGADPKNYEIIASYSVDESLRLAVDCINKGRATAIMKGRLESGDFMKAVVSRENGLVSGGRLSLIGFFEIPKYHKLLAVSDMGLNTYPDLDGKKAIVQNAVKMLYALGITMPKVAVLAAVEKLNLKMPDTVDADALKKMNASGEITNCYIEGPISFDLATSAESARIKGYESPVAGDADLMIVPDITAGNIMVKCMTGFGEAKTAGTVLGAKVPIVFTSRSAEAADKYYSIALASCIAAQL